MQRSTRINKVLIVLLLMCCITAQVIKASAKNVREEMEFLFREPQNDILAPITEVVMQVLKGVGIVAIIAVIVIGLIWFIRNKIVAMMNLSMCIYIGKRVMRKKFLSLYVQRKVWKY